MLRSGAWLAALTLFATCGLTQGCGGSPAPDLLDSPLEPLPPQPAEQSAEPAATAPGASPRERLQRVLNTMGQVRKLSPRGTVEGRLIERGEMIKLLSSQLDKQLPRSVRDASGEMLIAFGLAPHDFDYDASVRALLTDQLAGFYLPETKTMYLARDLPPMERHLTLTHELVHALQDQHFDIGPKMQYQVDRGDEQTAFHALAEGDATSAMLDEALAPAGRRATDLADELIVQRVAGGVAASLDGVPAVLRRSIVAPYIDGVVFVHWARRKGGWAYVNEVWRRPPRTTEQLLHPEKYEADEKGLSVSIPSAPSAGPQRLLFHDVMGEQALRLVLEEWLAKPAARAAASGWGGDRVAVYSSGAARAVAWHLTFDSEPAAERAFLGFTQALTAARPGAATRQLCQGRAAGPFVLMREKRDIVVTVGPYARRGGSKPRAQVKCGAGLIWARSILRRP